MTKDYIAGLFDGEGTVFVDPGTHYHIRVAIFNCNKELMDKLHGSLGGAVTVRYERHSHWKTSYIWRLGGDPAVRFLRGLLDVLIVKRVVAELALALHDSRVGWCKNESVDSVVTRELLYREFMKLNGKGKRVVESKMLNSTETYTSYSQANVSLS